MYMWCHKVVVYICETRVNDSILDINTYKPELIIWVTNKFPIILSENEFFYSFLGAEEQQTWHYLSTIHQSLNAGVQMPGVKRLH